MQINVRNIKEKFSKTLEDNRVSSGKSSPSSRKNSAVKIKVKLASSNEENKL